MTIRPATKDDFPAIINIYNNVILEGGFTADLHPVDMKEKAKWFESTNVANYGIFILIVENNVAGYFYFSPWRKGRTALHTIAELSFYMDQKYRGQGLGDCMLEKAIQLAQEKPFYHLMSILLDSNSRSQKLLEKWGFEKVGHLPNIAQLKDKTVGQFIMLRRI